MQPLAGDRSGTLLCGLLIVAILAVPLPYGSVPRPALLALQWVSAFLFAVAWADHRNRPGLAPGFRPLIGAFLVLVACAALQILPIPRRIAERLATELIEARQSAESWLAVPPASFDSLSLSPPDSLDALLRLLAFGALGFAGAVALRRTRAVHAISAAVVGSASAQALYGCLQAVSGTTAIFGKPNEHYPDVATGTFVNPNHFAAFLTLAIPFAVSMALRPASRSPQRHAPRWKEWVLRLGEPREWRRPLAAGAVLLLWAGVLFSQSRSGFVAAAVATAVVTLGVAVRSAPGRRRWIVTAPVLLLPVLLIAIWSGPRDPGERWFASSGQLSTLNGRTPVWRAAAAEIPSNPWLGSGLGTFESVFDRVRPPGVERRWTHAHNEYLQVTVEAGIPGLLASLALLAAGARILVGRMNDGFRLQAWAGIASLSALAVFASVDFPLRIPAVCLLAVLLPSMAGTGVGCGEGQQG